MVRYLVGMQVDILELLHHQEEQPRLVELIDGVVEVELFQHLAHIVAETIDVGAQVGGKAGRVVQQSFKAIERGVIKGVAGSPAQLRREIIKLPFEAVMGFQYPGFGWLQNTIDAPQHGERQDDILLLAALEDIADKIGDAPDEVDFIAMVVHIPVFSNTSSNVVIAR